MSGSDDRGPSGLEGNPFPDAAVAQVLRFTDDTPTVETRAITDARRRLREYLTRSSDTDPGTQQGGTVVAVVGDYGTGKSHLLGSILFEARAVIRAQGTDPQFQSMYLDAPAGSFLELYRGGFVRRLWQGRDVVVQRVREYYADIVADSLAEGPFPREVTDRLRSGQLDPHRFVEQFGLMESVFLGALRERLRAVTDNDQFSTALMLLLRGEYSSQLWEWFGGGGPDPVLSERAISSAIDDDVAALEAIGVFAVLLGGRDHRFILAIDELEQVLSLSDRPPDKTIDAFKTLLSMAANAGVFLILAGLPDFLNTLGGNVRDRIGPVLRPDELSPEDVADYIRKTLRGRHPRGELGPFSDGTIGYLTWLAGGNARRVIQLCHTAYELAGGEKPISESMLRQAAQQHFQITRMGDVRAHVRRVLQTGGHQFRAAHRMGRGNELLADFWVLLGAPGSGCAILLTDSVLNEAHANDLVALAERFRTEVPQSRVLLVVNGYLVPAFAEMLALAFGDAVIDYAARRFAEDLEAALSGLAQQLRAHRPDDPLSTLGMQVDRMIRMLSSTQRYVEDLAFEVETSHSRYDQQFTALHRKLDGEPYRQASLDPPGALPAGVEELFAQALGGLTGLNSLESLLTATFEATEVDVGQLELGGQSGRTALRQLSDQNAFEAVGVAALVQKAVFAFQRNVRRWHGKVQQSGREVDAQARQRLDRLCRSYDAVLENLPLFRLDDLTEYAVRTGTRSELLGWSTLPARQAEIRETIENLGTAVYTALVPESA